MADDDELVIVGVTNSRNKRKSMMRKRLKQARRLRRKHSSITKPDDMPDTSFSASKSQQECYIIEEPKDPTEDPADLIVLDSVESDEGEDVGSQQLSRNGHHNSSPFSNNQDYDVTHLLEKIRHLEEENHSLKYGSSKKDGRFSITSPSDGPPIEVIFFDAALAQKYRSEVERFLLEISSKEKTQNADRRNSKTPEGVSSFVLDKATTNLSHHHSKDWAVPVYTSDFGEALQVCSESEQQTAAQSTPETCFNCNGNHLIKDCPEKLDQRRITQNKRKSYNQRTPTNNKGRMGNEKLWQLKYKPGVISDALRSALSLKPIQIPGYIYTMRVLGYPPGWLKDAEENNSGINIYDSDGNIVRNDNNEDGEIDCEEIKVNYDPSKFIDYPGYNVPVPKDCIDEHLKLGFPSMQLHQQRAEIEKFMKPPTKTPYRKKRTPLHSKKRQKSSDESPRDIIDMEIEDVTDITTQSSDENSQREHSSGSPLPLQIDDDSADQSQGISSQDSSRVSSPTLTDLEERKMRLMQDLEAASGEDSDTPKQVYDCTSLEEVEIVLATPSRSSNGASALCTSKSVAQGTPVLGQHSPFQKLPEATVFSMGISDHINYENLPNATGCYDKLRVVLNNVRRKTSELLD